jgi:hypothetical protein
VSVIRVTPGPPAWAALLFDAGRDLVKRAGDQTVAYNLSGQLYHAATGWLCLSVPNALVHGIFAAMDEPGVELPPGPDGRLNAHVSVMRPEEVELAGGADKITERGKRFGYSLGRFVEVEPDGWKDVAKAWFVRVHSPELQALRRSYGLSGLPNDGGYDFHITCAVRRRGVLARNEKTKGAPATAGALAS